MLRESNAFEFALAVWGNRSLLTHVTWSPRRTVSAGGLKRICSITTVYVVGEASTPPENARTSEATTPRLGPDVPNRGLPPEWPLRLPAASGEQSSTAFPQFRL